VASRGYRRGVERTGYDVLTELFARDVDRALLRQSQARTPTQRIQWLEDMQSFAEAAAEARRHEAAGSDVLPGRVRR